MAPSRPPGPARPDPFAPYCPDESPGPAGLRDQDDPNYCSVAGDSPGPVGRNDVSEMICLPEENFSSQAGAGQSLPDEPEKREDIWVFSQEDLVYYGKTVLGFKGTADDAVVLIAALRDFGFHLKGSDYTIRVIKGKRYIAFKGYAGLRKTLTAPKYLLDNTKVVNMMIGREVMLKSAVKGTIVSFVLVATVEVIEFLVSDEMLFEELGVNLFSGLTKAAIASAAGFIATTVLISAGVISASAVAAPIAVGIAVAVAVTVGLEMIDNYFQITTKLRAAVVEASKPMRADLRKVKREWQWLNQSNGEGLIWLQRRLAGY